MHGGAYIVGAPAGYHGLGGALANGVGATVYMPEYRKAPEFPYRPRSTTASLPTERCSIRDTTPGR